MPTLETTLKDLQALAGTALSIEELEHRLDWVKGEMKSADPKTGELKIELNDTNRPDLWSVEGIARQLRGGKSPSGRPWDRMIETADDASLEIRVDPGVKSIRPIIGGFVARGPGLGSQGLAQLIQSQERLSDLFGRKRSDIAVGIYPLRAIAFPLRYEAVPPDSQSFVPLGLDESLTLREVLDRHPKGKTYGALLSGHPRFPVLKDASGAILSLPPITNAKTTGEVQETDGDLFVEATGFDRERVRLVLNILAANLFDRGFRISSLTVSEDDRTTRYPDTKPHTLVVPRDLPARVAGEPVEPDAFRDKLLSYGYDRVETAEGGYRVEVPFYRDDILHPVDCVEDYLIAKGYDAFSPALPSSFTAGREARARSVEDKIRELMIGLGFQELLSNILTSVERDTADLGREAAYTVEIDNPVSRQYGAVRSTLISFLLNSEAQSSRFPYPHRLFEVGEALEKRPPGPEMPPAIRDKRLFSGLIAHPSASVSEMAGVVLEALRYLGVEPRLESADRPPYISGRSGLLRLTSQSEPIGEIGEVHPEYLERWGIRMPTALFEIDLDRLFPALGPSAPR